jgi:hypothetical protein
MQCSNKAANLNAKTRNIYVYAHKLILSAINILIINNQEVQVLKHNQEEPFWFEIREHLYKEH